MKSPGVIVSPLPNYYGRHHFNEVFFDNVRIPACNLVGDENRGWYLLMQALTFERRSTAPITYGGFKRLLEELVQYVKETQCDGRPLSQDPVIRHKLADMAIELEMLKLFAYQLTWRLSQGDIPVYESSRNKVMGDDLAQGIAIVAAEILGAFSQVDPNSRWAQLGGAVQGCYLGFPGQAIAAGTAEVEKSIIGQFKLGLPKSY